MADQPAKPSRRPFLLISAAIVGAYLLYSSFSSKHKNTFNMAARTCISILSLSQNRAVVGQINEVIRSHGFHITGILESNPFSESELALALRVLEPRPQAVLVGKGYSEEVTNQVRDVFGQYASEVGVSKGTVVKITPQLFEDLGQEGVSQWVLDQFQAFFGNECNSLL